MIGTVAGGYVFMEPLGEGAFAEVFLAEEREGRRRFAIKVLRQHMTREPVLLQRFHNEAACAELLRECPHIVRVHEVIQVRGCPALVMDYVDGVDVQRMLDAAPQGLGVPRALRFAHDVAFALAFAHRSGVCHRDVKPSNCLVDHASQRVFLSDFGIALRAGAKRVTQVASGNGPVTIGTVAYMAPEVLRSGTGESGPQGDVYALGVMLYEMLTGVLPFDADQEFDLMHKVVNDPVPLPSARCGELPAGIDELVSRCLAKDPQHRFREGEAVFAKMKAVRDQMLQAGLDPGFDQEAVGPAPAVLGVLIDVTDPLKPLPYPVPAQGLSIGFDPANELVLQHPRVSGRHAHIAPMEGGFLLTDRSTNGTWVRGHRVHRGTMQLFDGDLLSFGRAAAAPRCLLVLR